MNTHALKTTLTTIGLLAAGAILPAQTEGDSFALPKPNGANLYLEAGGVFAAASMPLDLKIPDLPVTLGINSDANFTGARLAFGFRVNKQHKVQFEFARLSGSDDGLSINNGEESFKTDTDYTAMPFTLSYNYCIPLGQTGRWELRLGPSLGFYNMKASQTLTASYDGESESISLSDTDSTFVYGAGIGLTYHFSKQFHVDFEYRHLHMGKVEYDFKKTFYDGGDEINFGYKVEVDDMNSHSFALSFGWKF
ncbi:MAG: outer membrane beta-barrel protein [Opitutaceae bacterium]|nr:outer membrane beta-barrel protein [Opitutaceae bacterium]